MRIVLDTNVLISGIFFGGPPHRILKAWGDKRLQVLLSNAIVEEYRNVAAHLALQYPTVDVFPILDLLITHGAFVNTAATAITVCDDPDDNKFLECAIAGECSLIVSGDRHLLKLCGYKDLTILTPRQFIDRYLPP